MKNYEHRLCTNRRTSIYLEPIVSVDVLRQVPEVLSGEENSTDFAKACTLRKILTSDIASEGQSFSSPQ